MDINQRRICGEPALVVGSDNRSVSVLGRDGKVVSLSGREFALLRRMVQFASGAEHVGDACGKDIEAFVCSLAQKMGISVVSAGRVARWIRSSQERAGQLLYGGGPADVVASNIFGKLFTEHVKDLGALDAKRLLVDFDDLANSITGDAASHASGATITTIFIVTCNRPVALLNSSSSIVATLNRLERAEVQICCVDDSRDNEIERKNSQTLTDISQGYRGTISHFYSKAKKSIIEYLRGQLALSNDLVEFAFSPPKLLPTTGAARNWVLLLAAGGSALVFDDDTQCELTPHPNQSNDLEISGSPDPCDTWFYANDLEIRNFHSPDPTADILAIHESVLGYSLSTLANGRPNILIKDVNRPLLKGLRAGAGRVVLSTTGTAGFSGMRSGAGFLVDSDCGTLDRLKENPGRIDLLSGGRVFRAAPTIKVERGSPFTGMSFALDGSHLHPPFFPLGRNSDGVFSILSSLADNRAWMANLPWAVTHKTDPGRRHSMSHLAVLKYVGLTDIIRFLLDAVKGPDNAAPLLSLPMIGEQLVSISALSDKSFGAYLHSCFSSDRRKLLERLDIRIESLKYDQNGMVGDLLIMRRSVQESIRDQEPIVAMDLLDRVPREVAFSLTRDFVGKFGHLLKAWPTIISVAKASVEVQLTTNAFARNQNGRGDAKCYENQA